MKSAARVIYQNMQIQTAPGTPFQRCQSLLCIIRANGTWPIFTPSQTLKRKAADELTRRIDCLKCLLGSCGVHSDSGPYSRQSMTRQNKSCQSLKPCVLLQSCPHLKDRSSGRWSLWPWPGTLRNPVLSPPNCTPSLTPNCAAWSRLMKEKHKTGKYVLRIQALGITDF